MEQDHELIKFLDGVIGVVEATSYEKHMLWDENQRICKRSWEDDLLGHGRSVGFVNEKPVMLPLTTAKIDGHKILFVYPTSVMVDWNMIWKWLRDNLPLTARRKYSPEFVNKVDAMNFCNVFP